MKFNDFEAGTQLYLCVKCIVENKDTGVKKVRDISLKTMILSNEALPDYVVDTIPSGFRVCSNIRVNGYNITFDNSQIDVSIIVTHKAKNYKF